MVDGTAHGKTITRNGSATFVKFVGEYDAEAGPFRRSYDGRPLKAA